MGKIRKTNTKEVSRFKQLLKPKEENRLLGIFIYENDHLFLKKLLKSIKHIAFIKSIISFLAEHKDNDVPRLIFEFTNRKYTKGYRSSLFLILEKYDCSFYIYELLNLFLKDSYNTTWYTYDILVKYLKKIEVGKLKKILILISNHIPKEKEINKRKYQEFLLKKINLEIQKKSGKKQ